ncbi:MAG: acetyl-CoA hydrolase/transferase C-terminal domain-containing protein [Candidatus Bathyarchaeia archaeon]|jgi:4-hydroxybutyrate CoA-transferase
MWRVRAAILGTGNGAAHECATAFTGGVKPIVQLIKGRRADFYPIPLSKAPWLIRQVFKPDIFVATVSPPDSEGKCSLGISVDYGRSAFETAKVVVAEVNSNMPRTRGDAIIDADRIDCFIKSDEPIYELPSPKITNLEKRLAENVTSLVPDGATIQVGYGAISESITPFLAEKKDLGLHSEMFPESAMTLIDQGALTGARKSLHKGRAVCAFAAGTRRLYEWLNDFKEIELKPFDYTNDPKVIAANSKMTTINTALQVDLYGNIYSDMLGFDQYSGAGGQPDFVIGSQLCPDGLSIIVLPSTAAEGKASRIVAHPSISQNPQAPAIPTVSRFHADYVVTEQGTASLRDKTVRERARNILEIAHPDFVNELLRDGRRLNLLS